MTARCFVDTNIFFYALGKSSFSKKVAANRLLDGMIRPVINGQVIRELVYNLRKKAGYGEEDVREVIRQLHLDCEVMADHETLFQQASLLREEQAVSYWDSLIMAAALAAGCDTLYSEDMQHGQRIAGTLRIINPFWTESD
ncbi:MAG: PIN domain-containing protein [Magnetococcales bacterium]|nr:PIN domain-containing protein [Magnetococcales bacterium]